eukprot:CAMPEP_0197037050 /NCGR_PEP_ID=MMETSP1384-20130603/14361_1 /TAXON_ID=29189 /ORGANISM="Ammonia sp." /LENGTH=782 /DNA_ID=CAMNT_0042467303 /DNA_START=37 /DNA_END=2385 /DNA_ORIENTATION=+
MADTSIKLDEKFKEQDPAYHYVLEDFRMHCENILSHYAEDDDTKDSVPTGYSTLGQKYSLNSNLPKPEALDNELLLLASELAFWIYTPDEAIPKPHQFIDDNFSHWHHKKIVRSKRTQIAQWAFLQFSAQPKNAYLIFKGTDPDKVFDIMADTAVIPMPIWCQEDAKTTNHKMDKRQQKSLSQQISHSDISAILANDSNEQACHEDELPDDLEDAEWQFCGHSGIYATLMRDFHRIWKTINRRIAFFDSLYIIGHSLGGGLAILFALESIINRFLPSNKSMKVITFGSPVVISYENQFHSLSRHAKRILFELHSCCHHIINRLDPVPRVPARTEWMMTVIPYALRKIIQQQVKAKMKLPGFLVPLVKSGVKTGVSKFVLYVEKYLEILESYRPVGTYYFFTGKDCDEPFITRNQTVVEELLGFIPPHKITTSEGHELRVAHYSTKVDGMTHESRFSLQHITLLTSPTSDNDGGADNGQFEMIGSDSQQQPGADENEEKTEDDILERLMQQIRIQNAGDGEGALYDNSSLYVSVESEDEKIKELYRKKKLSEDGWVMLVSNHLMEQYIDIFKAKVQQKHNQYPMLMPKSVSAHFAAPECEPVEEDELTVDSTAALTEAAKKFKTTGKNLWNSAKEKYNKEKEEYLKKRELEKQQKQEAAQSSNASTPYMQPPAHGQPVMYQQAAPYYYVQPPQQVVSAAASNTYQGAPPQQQYYAAPQAMPYSGQPTQPQPTMYVQQPTNLAMSGQPIGNTQYRIVQQPSHYVVYSQSPSDQQKVGYPSLAKR